MSSVPPDKSTELHKEFSETTSRARKFLISSAIILIILIVVVGQELREYRDKQASLVKQIQTTARSEGESIKRLFKEYGCIRCELKKTINDGRIDGECREDLKTADNSISRKVGIEIYDVPKGIAGAHSAKEVDALVRGEQNLAELIKNVKGKLDKDKEQQKTPTPPQPQRAGESRPEGASEAYVLSFDDGLLPPSVAPQAQVDVDTCKVAESDDKQPLSGLASHLTYYKELYSDRIALARVHLTTKKESDELKAAKKSIPTPFGSFQIAPKLALLGLAFAVLIAYFAFYNYVRKLRRLANDEAVAGPDSAALRIPGPFWSPDPRDGQIPQSSRTSDVVFSVLLQVLWIGVAIWLVVESLLIWKATKALEFEYRTVWGYLLLLTVALAVFIAVQQFVPARFKNRFLSVLPDRSPEAEVSRRRFVYLGTIGVIGVLTAAFIYRAYAKHKRGKAERPQLAEFTATPVKDDWIQNERNGVIHYRPVCEKHLPAKKRQRKKLPPSNDKVHALLQARIWFDLSDRATKPQLDEDASYGDLERLFRQQDRDRISYIEKAIAASPLSLHLYDALGKVHGRLKDYEKIAPLFQSGLDEVKKRIAELPNPPKTVGDKKKAKLLKRMKDEFNLRIRQVEVRKRRADDFRAEMAEKDRKKNSPNSALK